MQGTPAFLDANRQLVETGAALHWLKPKRKRPVDEGWSTAPVHTIETLRASYRDDANVGIRLGEPSKTDWGYIHLIDLDIRDDAQADEAWRRLRALWPECDGFPRVVSGSGGASRHIYLLTDRPFRSKILARSQGSRKVWDEAAGREVTKSDWQIEFLGTAKQAVLPPSIHPETGLPYRWERHFAFDLMGLGVAPVVPAERVASWGAAEAPDDEDDEDDLASIVRASPMGLTEAEIRGYLFGLPEDWVEDRDTWLKVGQALHHEYKGSQTGFDRWCEWSRQSDKFNLRDSKAVWKSFKGARNPVRMATLIKHSGWRPPADLADASEPSDRIAELNSELAFVLIGGKARVLKERGDTFELITTADLAALYANDRVRPDPQSKRTVPISTVWLQSPRRRSYPGGLVFRPGKAPADAYNLWRGWTAEPNPGASCALFLAHVREVICDHDEGAASWLLAWMAHLVQRPEEKPGTAVVLRGAKGAGKDTVGRYFGSLFAHNHVTIAQPDHLTGRFNGHLAQALLLHLEEGFWAGDHRAEGVLKNLITCQSIQIERKGLDPIETPHFARLLITSNADWVVPATAGERRFLVLNVSDAKACNAEYFAAIDREMREGGSGALMHFLREYDLSGFNVRKPPETVGLVQQKVAGLKNVARFWFDLLSTGQLQRFDFEGPGADWAEGPVSIARSDLRERYRTWLTRHRFQGEAVSEQQFGVELRRYCPRLEDSRPRTDGQRVRTWTFPRLADARADFESVMGGAMQWDA